MKPPQLTAKQRVALEWLADGPVEWDERQDHAITSSESHQQGPYRDGTWQAFIHWKTAVVLERLGLAHCTWTADGSSIGLTPRGRAVVEYWRKYWRTKRGAK